METVQNAERAVQEAQRNQADRDLASFRGMSAATNPWGVLGLTAASGATLDQLPQPTPFSQY